MSQSSFTRKGFGSVAGIDFTPNWDFVVEGPDWFGPQEQELRRLSLEAAEALAGNCMRSLAGAVKQRKIPSTEELRHAEQELNPEIGRLVVSDEWIGFLQPLDGKAVSTVAREIERLLPPFELPRPDAAKHEISPVAAGICGAVGAVLGMLAAAGICRFALGTQNEGMLFGAALGALILTWGMIFVASNKTIQNRIIGILGVASIMDAVFLFASGWWKPLSFIFGIRAKTRLIRRIVIYVTLIIFVLMTRRKSEFDVDRYREAVRDKIRHHLDFALSIIAVLGQIVLRIDTNTVAAASSDGKTLHKIAVTARQFGQSKTVHDVGDVLGVLLQELRNGGYNIEKPDPSLFESRTVPEPLDERPPSIVWNEDLSDRYDVFGFLENGELAVVMEEPLLRDGLIVTKGQVKKSLKSRDGGTKAAVRSEV